MTGVEPAVAEAGFVARCRREGVKVTQQRLEVFRELLRATDHPTAEQVHTRLKGRMPTLSLDTVYRTLAVLERHGLAAKVMIFDGHGRYDGDLRRHHHMVCRNCKRIGDVNWPAFDGLRLPRGSRGWGRVQARTAELTGLCSSCASHDDGDH